MILNTDILVAVGTVPGREHARLSRNNQDGLAVRVRGDRLVAVVTDGCSSGAFSEVGARLGAAWLADAALTEDSPVAVFDAALSRLDALAPAASSARAAFVADYLLFTALVAVVTPERVRIYGVGDGVYAAANGDDCAITALDAGPDNAPPYLAYRLLESARLERFSGELSPTVHLDGPADFDGLLIGSDGVGDLPSGDGSVRELLVAPALARNTSLLQKRLNVLGPRRGQLPDDTTAVLLRRRS